MKRKNRTKDIVYTAIFVALMIIFTLFVSIPFYPVPLTFQTVICIMSGLIAGAKRGAAAMAIYVFIGLVLGMPVFSGGKGGFSAALSPTFGYIVGFTPAAAIAGLIRGKTPCARLPRYIAAAAAAFLVCYTAGTSYFLIFWKYYMGNSDVWYAALAFNIAYMPKDAILSLAAAYTANKLAPKLFADKDRVS